MPTQPVMRHCTSLHEMRLWACCWSVSLPSLLLFLGFRDFKNHDISGAGFHNVTSAQACCALCLATDQCNAMSFGPLPTFGCRLKSSDAGRKYFKGRTSFRCGKDPPTPLPTPNITEIHVVTSNHFDGGCKIGGCNNVSTAEDFMWPLGCAVTMHGPGQPHAYHVINRYFDEYFPLAASLGDKFRALGGTDKYVWMTQSWIISLFLNCDSAHYNAWDNSGRNLLHCPNETAVARFKRAVALGDITWHAAATDQEAEFFPNVGLFNASMEISDELAEQLGVARPISVSTRDVPFWSRAALPLLAARGIIGMSFGSGGPPGRPYGVPPLFVWRDIASGAEVVVTSESGYGGIGTEFVLPDGVALAVDWTGDNTGPRDPTSALATLRAKYPGAKVHLSTFDAFFTEANKPKNKQQLPVVTAEVGDAWIYGVPSDPLKCAQFRAVGRLRDECIGSGECNRSSVAMKTFDRLLVKVPEHTWGLAQSWFIPDYTNWSNVAFQKALKSVTEPVADNRDHADYFTQVQSWHEQRHFVTNAVDAVHEELPAFAERIQQAFATISDVHIPSTAGFTKAQPYSTLRCGTASIQFDSSGAVSMLANGDTQTWANSTHTLGKYIYQSFNDDDYQEFLSGSGDISGVSGFARPACRPNNTSPICGNFNKPQMALGGAKHREISPRVVGLWQDAGAEKSECRFLIQGELSKEAHIFAGAPSTVWTKMKLMATTGTLLIEFEFLAFEKTPTRLPEALFVQFKPAVSSIAGYRFEMFNQSDILLDPQDVMPSPGGSGGAPHTRCVSAVRWDAESTKGPMYLSSLDVPCIAAGKPTPFPTPRNVAPDMSHGVSYNIYNNIWNTNYVLWYPFNETDMNMKSRFTLRLG